MATVAARRLLLAATVGVILVLAVLYVGRPHETRSERVTRPAHEVTEVPSSEAILSQAPTSDPAEDPSAKKWRLQIEMRDKSDKPVAGCIYVTSAVTGELLSTLESKDGAPTIHEVTGVVDVVARGHDVRLAPSCVRSISPPATGARTLRVRLEGGLVIAGKLVDDGGNQLRLDETTHVQVRAEAADQQLQEPEESVEEELSNADEWVTFAASPGADGRFEILGLPPGRYGLTVWMLSDSLLPPHAEPTVVEAGVTDVVLVLRRTKEVRVKLVDADTGKAVDDVDARWRIAAAVTDDGLWAGVGRNVLVLKRPPGTSFVLLIEVESYEIPEPLRVVLDRDSAAQEFEVKLRRQAGGTAQLELLVRDDAGNPAFPIMIGHGSSSRRYEFRDGRCVCQVPAGVQRIKLCSPRDQILLFKREWIRDADAFLPAQAYLPLDVDVELPGGGRVTKEVTIQRAALVWVRQEPKGAFSGVRLLRGDAQVEHAFLNLYEEKGLVAAVEPGTYTIEGRAGEEVVKVEVAAKAAEVAEVWLRAESAK